MHIGVNGLRLSGQRFGVGRYIEYLLKYWDRQLGADERVTVFVRGEVDRQGLPEGGRVALRRLGPALTGTLWENGPLRRAARDVDVLFCPSYTAPLLGPTPRVVVTHSVDEARPGTHSWWHNQTRARLYRASARRGAAVIVPSAETRASVENLYGVAPARIHVIELGVDVEVFRPLAKDDPAVMSARQRYTGGAPYVLFVGKMSARRNIPLLLRAFALLKARGYPHKLLLFGPNHEGLPLPALTADLGIADMVVQDDGRVASHRELVPVYAGADVFVHPTTYDSSSLPITEAFACGLPVVTMRIGGLLETCGDAAVLLDDWSPPVLAEALARLIDDPHTRGVLVAKGLERAAARSWNASAARALAIVRDAAGNLGARHAPATVESGT